MTEEWRAYLTSAIRLVDLHDSGHSVGMPAVAPSEQRPGHPEGLWLDLGIQLLEYLGERDAEANGSWVLLDEFCAHVCARYPNLMDEDVQFVVTILSTPSTLTLVRDVAGSSRPTPYTTKETALLERPAHKLTDRCRLTPTGRRAIGLSRAGHDWLYAHHDAEKIVTAIKWGDFDQLPARCAYVAQSIRSFGHEITRALERPGLEALLQTFLEREANYREAIRNVQAAVEAGAELLHTQETIQRFDEWLKQRPDSELSLYTLHRSLVRLMQSVERLGRHFSDFIARVTSQSRETIGGVRFDKLAIHLAFKPPEPGVVSRCFLALGPWQMSTPFVGPEDLTAALRSDLNTEQSLGLSFEDELLTELPTCMERFLSAYRDQILTALEEGPISLQDAIRRGWLLLDGEMMLTQLVGVYAAPSWLFGNNEAPRSQLVISFQRDALNLRLNNGDRLQGDDLLLALVPNEVTA